MEPFECIAIVAADIILWKIKIYLIKCNAEENIYQTSIKTFASKVGRE